MFSKNFLISELGKKTKKEKKSEKKLKIKKAPWHETSGPWTTVVPGPSREIGRVGNRMKQVKNLMADYLGLRSNQGQIGMTHKL